MKKLKILFIAIVFLFLPIGMSLSTITVFAWGDSDGGRETYSLEEINNGASGDKITFNSIVIADSDYEWYEQFFGEEMPTGFLTNELNFVGAREDTGKNEGVRNVWNGNEIEVEDGKTYIVRLYVDNNGPNGEAGASENTRVAFYVPEKTDKTISVDGTISSSNASPSKYWDYVNFTSDVPFHLEYVYGSAFLENSGIGAGGGYNLSDDIINPDNEGILIGYDAMDGIIPGGYEYDCYIGIKVKVVYDYEFMTETKVRLANGKDKTWQTTISADVGDIVEFQIEYKNISDYEQLVAIRDVLPENLQYIENSTKLYNALNDGTTSNGKTLVNEGLRIGTYWPGANAFMRFSAEVVDVSLAEGSNTLVNWGQGIVGTTTMQDYARVVVYKNTKYKITVRVLLAIIAICIIGILVLLYKIHRLKHPSIFKRRNKY